MKLKWIEDPVTKQSSVTLTLLVLSTVVMVGVIFANVYGAEVDDSLVLNFWFGSLGAYVGRRTKISKDNSQMEGILNE